MEREFAYVFVGGYGDQYWTGIAEPTIRGNCQGISVCKLDLNEGTLSVCGTSDSVVSPSTLIVSPNGKYLYASNETSDFLKRGFGGGISAFSFDSAQPALNLINQSLAYGAFPAYINIDKTGKYLLVANHGSKLYCTRFEEKDGKRQYDGTSIFTIDTSEMDLYYNVQAKY